MTNPFQPQGTVAVANSTSATAGILSGESSQVALYNSSATAVVYWVCQVLNSASDAGPTATVPTSTPGGMPVPPGQLIRITVGRGPKKFSVIASAADGNLFVTPGEGN